MAEVVQVKLDAGDVLVISVPEDALPDKEFMSNAFSNVPFTVLVISDRVMVDELPHEELEELYKYSRRKAGLDNVKEDDRTTPSEGLQPEAGA